MASGRRSMSTDVVARPFTTQPRTDWLPQAQAALHMNNSHVGPYVQDNKNRHWFLAFSDAIYHRAKDPIQARVVAKVYAFLHDFMPDGFVGRWSHIRGQDVMHILMCERKDMAVSRHKATQNAQAGFEYLEMWMKKGDHWQEAVKKDAETSKKKGPRKCPILHSPAGLVALLVISYPDPKYRRWVGRLGVEWMMQDTVNVSAGFWKGITTDDIATIFQLPKARFSEVPLLADYTLLFGDAFVSARQDIRPFLPNWAKDAHICLDGASSDVEEPDDEAFPEEGSSDQEGSSAEEGKAGPKSKPRTSWDGGDADLSGSDDLPDLDDSSDLESSHGFANTAQPSDEHKVGDADTISNANESIVGEVDDRVGRDLLSDPKRAELRLDLDKLLHPKMSIPIDKLLAWLMEGMATKECAVLSFWCRGWAERMEEARNFEEQAILRSIFLQSIRSVHGFATSKIPTEVAYTEAFMLLDIEDSKQRHVPSDPETMKHIRRLEQLPAYQPLREARTKLYSLAPEQSKRDLLAPAFDEQLLFFRELFQNQLFSKHIPYVVTLDAARTNHLIQRATRRNESALPRSSSLLIAPLHPMYRADDSMITRLKLTKWQLRTLAVSELEEEMLTDWQARVYRRVSGAQRLADASQYAPIRARAVEVENSPELSSTNWEELRKLFGDLHQAFVSAYGEGAWNEMYQVQHHEHRDASLPRTLAPIQETSVLQTPTKPTVSGVASPARLERMPVRTTSWNPYAGLSSAKRACSPDVRNVKVPRLAGPTTQESIEQLKTDMTTSNERLRDELKTLIAASKEEALESVAAKMASDSSRIEKRIVKTAQQTEGKLQSITDTLAQIGEQMRSTIKSAADAMEAQTARDRTQTQATLKSIMDTLEGQRSEDGQRVEAKIQALAATIDTLQQSVAAQTQAQAELLPGQEGYLTAHCPSPLGLDQKSYEQTLHRAAWYYLYHVAWFDSPDDSPDADPNAFEYTMERFPSLDRQHLERALAHVHSQGYDQPVREGSQEAGLST